MPQKLLDMLGYDPDDPQVAAGRRHDTAIAGLIDDLVQLREKRQLTQAQVAEQMDTTQSCVSNFERQSGDPKLSTVLRYADAVGAEVSFLVAIAAPIAGPVAMRSGAPRSVDAGGERSYYTTPRFGVAVH